jgi:solute:Na+ symporter, SSS family
MHWIDWLVLLGTLLGIVAYGTLRNRKQKNLKGYLLGDGNLPWWTIGISVMATQASAVTFLSTPGQAYDDGMRFIQFYFGMPLAVIVVAAIIIPVFYKAGVYTAYGYLDKRFGAPVRYLTAFLFLIQRGLAAGLTIYAPSIVLSTVLHIPLNITNIFIGVLVIVYTVSGGSKAVAQTQKLQLTVMMGGLFVAMGILLWYISREMSVPKAMEFAGAAGKWNFINWNFDTKDKYNVWSGVLGGFFLSLAYFGTDQSQVGRYLGGKSSGQAKIGMIFNALFKIPMQLLILFVGVLVFIFFQTQPVPIHFNTTQLNSFQGTEEISVEKKLDFIKLETEYEQTRKHQELLREHWISSQLSTADFSEQYKETLLREKEVRLEAGKQIEASLLGADKNDKDYVFLYFIMNFLPIGIVGLLLAMIFSGAMSSTSSELNALGSVTALDLIQPIRGGVELNEKQQLALTRWSTISWGILAIIFAAIFNLFDNLIQAVNILGSLFYGTILGIFLTGFMLPKIGGRAVFWAALCAEGIVLSVFYLMQTEKLELGWLWLNPIGCIGVMVIALLLNMLFTSSAEKEVE